MKIAVLMKQVPDTWSDRKLDLTTGQIDRTTAEQVADEINERALESALRHKDQDASTEIVAVTMGPTGAQAALRRALSMGADSAILVNDPSLAGSDMVRTALALASALRDIGPDLVLAGNESTDGRGGLVPAMIAEVLQFPHLPAVDRVEISDSQVTGQLQVEGAVVSVQSEYPALVSVTEQSAEARIPNFKGIMKAKKKPLDVKTLADLGIDVGPGAATAKSVMVGATERPPRNAGTKITDDGTAAQQLAEFLSSRRLLQNHQ
ncbi:electron transfer flavoprotein subunit beta/FixA family protein [Arthrobacter sp. EpRS71]|uniref:electron transfer flavoprotein subunit beta/FixA family protein n=1 Tax=Arthrobacter sp. EpRS71 TaxID=1743141 RepID=UPI00074798B9|nr:electron transfer flavoprotein subunit beta/FixA family protein [Arthrobacter sp. EpRS71]KUM36382.1 electron transfer flavoprotein subunit beta [Arthrobacter sp. EpRS71]